MIKVKKIDKNKTDNYYPKLMKYKDSLGFEFIILRTSHTCGTVVDVTKSEDWNVGDYYEHWTETDENWTEYNGTITLSNC